MKKLANTSSWSIRTKIMVTNLGISVVFTLLLLFILAKLFLNSGNMRRQGELLDSQSGHIQSQRQQTGDQADLLRQQLSFQAGRDQEIAHLQHVRAATTSFLNLAYWLTDLALSQQSQSEREAKEHRRSLNLLLEQLAKTDAAAIAQIKQEVGAFSNAMMEAVDSYTEDNRVQGNARAALAHVQATAIIKRLATLDVVHSTQVAEADRQMVAVNDRLRASGSSVLQSAQALDASRGQIAESTKHVIESNRFLRVATLACIAIGLLSGTILSWLLARSLTSRLNRTLVQLDAVARGDLTPRQTIDAKDEIGRMAEALNHALDALQASIGTLASSAQTLTSSSKRLVQNGQQMDSEMEAMATTVAGATSATAQVSSSMDGLATGIQEMNQSIEEISRNATAAAGVAGEAVGAVTASTAAAEQLGEATAAIKGIIGLITRITKQTDLLALNAAIEAAQAGEAGRGFSVVAGEVKELARQTALATADVSAKIGSIQSSSDLTRTAIQQIDKAIGRVNSFQQSIASAVEQQAATTRDIATTVEQAKAGSLHLRKFIEVVAAAAQRTKAGSVENQRAAVELSDLAGGLDEEAKRFVIDTAPESSTRSRSSIIT